MKIHKIKQKNIRQKRLNIGRSKRMLVRVVDEFRFFELDKFIALKTTTNPTTGHQALSDIQGK